MALDVIEPHPETRANFALMETQPGAMERYWRLAVETSEYQKGLEGAGILNSTSWIEVDGVASIRYLAKQIPQEYFDSALFSRWEDWSVEFEEIYKASPKWRLKEMISQISETHNCCSWPMRWEQEIWKWALSEKGSVSPFDDRKGVVDADFVQRLRALIEHVDGFLYRCEESGQIVFIPTDDLPRIWRHQDHLSEIDRNRRFGFFYDATRPNSEMRAPTEEEERILATIQNRTLRKKGWRALLMRYVKRLTG